MNYSTSCGKTRGSSFGGLTFIVALKIVVELEEVKIFIIEIKKTMKIKQELK